MDKEMIKLIKKQGKRMLDAVISHRINKDEKPTKDELKKECKDYFEKIVWLRAKGRDEAFPELPGKLVHHVIPRALCGDLIFEPDNGVLLHGSSHTKHHVQWDPEILARIIRKRGWAWFERLVRIRMERKAKGLVSSYYDYKYYEDKLKYLKKIYKNESHKN
jgi:hypothetical protein